MIGAQNAYLLRQGLRRMRVGVIVAICTLSDLALIAAGVSGIGAVVQHAGWALVVVRWFGVAFLAWYGLSSAWRARRGDALRAAPDDPRSRHAVVRQTLSRSPGSTRTSTSTPWCSSARSRTRTARRAAGGSPPARRAGERAVVHSASDTARGVAAGLLATARAWQVLDLLIAATMLGIAVKLALI